MKLAMMLGDGFEPLEVVAPVDALRRGGVDVVMVSVMPTRSVTAAQGIAITADAQVDEVNLMAFDAICVPGGEGGVANLKACTKLAEALPKFVDDDRLTAASICAGPTVLNELGLLTERTATCYPGCEVGFPEGTYVGQGICVDGNLITASGPGYALGFGLAILRHMAGDAVADQVAADMLYQG